MKIRRFQAGDGQEIWQLRFDTTRKIIARDYSPALIRRWAPEQMDPGWNERIARKNPFVAEHEGTIVGFAELEVDGHIGDFYAHYQWQRRGVGKRLLAAVEEEARRLQVGVLFLESSVTAHQFFLSRGFEIVEMRSVFINGEEVRQFLMRKSLVSTPTSNQDGS